MQASNDKRKDGTKSLEELTAEMGAAFLCQMAQLDTSKTIKNSASYIASCLKPLQENPKWILQASKQAREALEKCYAYCIIC